MSSRLHTILVFAQNKRGVLERISMLIRKKMYNLEQITASDSEKPGIKQLTISFSHKDGEKITQIASQIKKIVEVISVQIIDTDTAVIREVALIKVKRPESLSEILSLVDIFQAKVVNTTSENMIIQVVGSPNQIKDFTNLISKFEILSQASSGGVAMMK